MKPEHKRYILENINKKPIKKIAQDLNIKERKIRKFLEKQKVAEGKQPAATNPTEKKTILISIALIIILGFSVYANSLDAKFSWDDEALVKNNIYIRNWSRLPNIFTENIGAGAGEIQNFYRPLQMITYMFDYSLWKSNVRGYHLTNIFLHLLAALSIYCLINILYDNRFLSLLAGLFFVVHPVHTEAVTYISGRADSLSLLFMLLSLIFYVKYLHKNSAIFYLLVLVSYISALLSRENALIFPILLLLYHYTFKKRLSAKAFLPILSLTFFYIILRFTVLKDISPYTPVTSDLFQRLPGFFVAITNYMRLLILPVNLHMEYGNMLFNFANPKATIGMIIFFSLLVYIFKIRNSTNKRVIFFSICWFILTLLPHSNLYPINAYMAEHWLYVPSVGFFLILANLFNYIYTVKKFKIFSIGLIISLLIFYSYLTIKQNSYWKDSLTLYERTLIYAPDSPRLHSNLSAEYHRLGRYDEAIKSYKNIIENNPNYSEMYKVYNNLGVAYHAIGRREEAIAVYKKAIGFRPDYPNLYYNLGMVYSDISKYEEAIASYKKGIEIKPDSADADMYNKLGIAYSVSGKYDEAISSFKKAIELDPRYIDPYDNLGKLYCSMNNYKEAIDLYKKLQNIHPDYADVYNNLAVAYYYEKQYDLAIEYCDKALGLGIKVHPDFLKLLEPYRK